jgi:CBS domain-containing protein
MNLSIRQRMSHSERVEIRTRRIIGEGGETAVAHSVLCPMSHESKLLVDCEVCERCEELTPEKPFLVCELPGMHPPPAELIARRVVRSVTAHTPISDVMQRDVVCVTADLSLEALSALFLEHSLSGVPVVNKAGHPIGIVGKADLLRERLLGEEEAEPPVELEPGFHLEPPRATVGDVMMRVAYTLHESSSLGDAIKLMSVEGVQRLPVVDQGGRVVGILSAMDVLRWLDA